VRDAEIGKEDVGNIYDYEKRFNRGRMKKIS
jgi:hypothetical protein